MLSVAVRALDGNVQHVAVSPHTTMASLRADVEQALALPAFHEVRLLDGTRELADGAPIVSEVQAVKTVSPSKIVDCLTNAQQHRKVRGSLSQPLEQQRLSAIALLTEQADLPRVCCEQLLTLLSAGSFHDGKLAAAFGWACGDPTPYMQGLLKLQYGWLLVPALAAVVRRLGAASLRAHAADILRVAQQSLGSGDGEWTRPIGADAFFLLGEYGDATHKDALRKLAGRPCISDKVRREAMAALKRIAGRLEARVKDAPGKLAPQDVRSSSNGLCDPGFECDAWQCETIPLCDQEEILACPEAEDFADDFMDHTAESSAEAEPSLDPHQWMRNRQKRLRSGSPSR